MRDAYDATLGRIKKQGGEKARLGMAALMWIYHSERPLKADELCHALAVEIGSPNFDADKVPSIRTLLACCHGLVAVGKEPSTVRLTHSTVQEYLRIRPELFSSAHSTIAETCLSYLNSRQVKALPVTDSHTDGINLQSTPFLEYSSLYWGMHAKRELSDCAKLLTLKLFDCSNHISTKLLLGSQELSDDGIDYDNLSLFGGLHCASLFGIVEIVAGLVEVEGCDINQVDCIGDTPLVWAARNRHQGVVEILLGRDDIDPDKPGVFGQTPLSCAAWNGHESVVKILLGRGEVDPNGVDNDSETPLSYAAGSGHEGVVKILLDRDDVDPDKPASLDRTPFCYAAGQGHRRVAKLLLERGEVRPDKQDNFGRTPLFYAALNGDEGMVKMLLGRGDIRPDTPDTQGRTPLSSAAEDGREGVVEILLRRDGVSPGMPDKLGRTPLWYATEEGHAGVIALLQPPESTTPRAN